MRSRVACYSAGGEQSNLHRQRKAKLIMMQARKQYHHGVAPLPDCKGDTARQQFVRSGVVRAVGTWMNLNVCLDAMLLQSKYLLHWIDFITKLGLFVKLIICNLNI